MKSRSALRAAIVSAAAATLFASSVSDDNLAAWVEKKIRDLQPSRAERRIDEIGFASGILEAERLGRSLGRPVFLFTYDGRIDTGRC